MMKSGLFFMIFSCLLYSALSQRENGNIWDMLINDGNNIDLPPYNAPSPINYGPRMPPVEFQGYPVSSSSNVGISLGGGGSFAPSSILKPKVEILKLLESFIQFKAELASRLYAVAVDNWDTIIYLFNTFVNNIGTLSAFTINGIVVLRRVLEAAARLFGSWQITVPNVNVDFSTLLRESNFYNVD